METNHIFGLYIYLSILFLLFLISVARQSFSQDTLLLFTSGESNIVFYKNNTVFYENNYYRNNIKGYGSYEKNNNTIATFFNIPKEVKSSFDLDSTNFDGFTNVFIQFLDNNGYFFNYCLASKKGMSNVVKIQNDSLNLLAIDSMFSSVIIEQTGYHVLEVPIIKNTTAFYHVKMVEETHFIQDTFVFKIKKNKLKLKNKKKYNFHMSKFYYPLFENDQDKGQHLRFYF
ncbi:MAG: hypothetical protein JXR68_09120 [Bacteroidales bacterium]|nr:hypothetical protein [Bacteroidales bacterium]